MRDTISAVIQFQFVVALLCTAPYAEFVNDGHYTQSGSYVAANPFFTKATQKMSLDMIAAMAGLLGG